MYTKISKILYFYEQIKYKKSTFKLNVKTVNRRKMVEVELVKTSEEYVEIITTLISEIEKMKEDHEDPIFVNKKVDECSKVIDMFEMSAVDEKWLDVACEYKKYIAVMKSKCIFCNKYEKTTKSEEFKDFCDTCIAAGKYIDENTATVELFKLAKDDPEKYFEKCGYLCFACVKEIPESEVKWCSKCKVVCYCNRACQKADWHRKNGHKKDCKNFTSEFGKTFDKEILLQIRALKQANLMSVVHYAIEKLRTKKVIT